jgi:hypothetical protein
MAGYIDPKTGLPDGKWDQQNPQTHYWMIYKKFHYYSDTTGNEFIEINKQVREAIAEVRDQLAEHQIDIINVSTQQYLEPMMYNNVIGVAVAFRSREDLVMAKMLVECDSVYGL